MKDLSTLIGLLIAVIAIGLGMILKGASLSALINPAAYLVIFGGTTASLFVGFPMKDIKKFPKLIKIAFSKQDMIPKHELIQKFTEWATIARREGILGLEAHIEQIDEPFLKQGMQLIIDSQDSDFVRDVLVGQIHMTESRHRRGALLFSQAGTYAPTLGVLGAVLGLIAALGNLGDVDQLGHSIAAAFIATLLGIFSGYVLWHPLANKLKLISQNEVELKQIMIEGLLSIQEGLSSMNVEQKLSVFLSPDELRHLPKKEEQF